MITRQQRDHKAGPIIASSRRACMLKSRSLSLCFLRTKGAEFQSRRPCRNKRRGITNDQAIGTESFPNLHSAYIIWLDRGIKYAKFLNALIVVVNRFCWSPVSERSARQ